jgi:hypothetical protein
MVRGNFPERIEIKTRNYIVLSPAHLIFDVLWFMMVIIFWTIFFTRMSLQFQSLPRPRIRCDLSAFALTQRLVRRLNETGHANIQTLRVGTLLATYHSASNPVHVIASFQNAGTRVLFHHDGSPIVFVNRVISN